MLKPKYNWQLPANQPDEAMINELSQACDLSTLAIQVLYNRGYDTVDKIQNFLKLDPQVIHDPFLLHDMQKAVDRIQTAIVKNEKIVVYGDYDADGVTSTTIMFETLTELGATVDYFVPDRFQDGYGPNLNEYQRLIESGVTLLVTVDNGIAGNEAVNYAVDHGMDVIITDHHEMPEILPEATAIVHPRYPGSQYPFSDLSGVGVAFKVACALLDEVPEEFLDLVAIGTIGDLVSLIDENRFLVVHGLQVLSEGQRVGLAALLKLSGLKNQAITEQDIGFTIAPKLNAVGRIGNAGEAVELLTTFDEEKAGLIAKHIDSVNNQRKQLVADIYTKAIQQAELPENQSRQTLVITGEGWHQGVLGIVASRLVEATGKPTLVLSSDPEVSDLKGSGRSVPTLNLFEALNKNRTLYENFGGHHMAVGLTIKKANLTALKQLLEAAAQAAALDASQPETLNIDSRISVDQITLAGIKDLAKLGPFGTDNPIPVFAIAADSVLNAKQIGSDQAHLKFQLTGGQQTVDAIAFQQGPLLPYVQALPDHVQLAGTLELNTWRNQTKPQIMVKDLFIDAVPIVDQRTTHLNMRMFERQTTYVFFHKKTYKQVQPHLSHDMQIAIVDNDDQQNMSLSGNLTLVDCPDSLEKFSQWLTNQNPDAVTVYFYQRNNAYLDGMPTREQSSKVFKFFVNHPVIDLNKQLQDVSKHLHMQQSILVFLIQVFFELGFVKIESGRVSLVSDPKPQKLSAAPAYQLRQQQIKTQEKLLYSKSATLTAWMQACLTDENKGVAD
ncbi:single-stranded-DNA-specific exonuclease RecJ [Pediococcus siamensis]|uniref:single-stranded-DNA-specific exonuclease RecJ n=1 Tax=Pediococcus siamensis TaxID=381829 RepID=UPI0039A1B225